MQITLSIFFGILFAISSAWSFDFSPDQEKFLNALKSKLLKTKEFKDLRKAKLRFVLAEDRIYPFFSARPTVKSVSKKNGLERDYVIFVSPGIFQDPPSELAVEAIISHEMFHVQDYLTMTPSELILLGIRSAKKAPRKYERATDLKALELGYADGLYQYRIWLKRQLPAKKLKEVYNSYYSPKEILEWKKNNEKREK